MASNKILRDLAERICLDFDRHVLTDFTASRHAPRIVVTSSKSSGRVGGCIKHKPLYDAVVTPETSAVPLAVVALKPCDIAEGVKVTVNVPSIVVAVVAFAVPTYARS
jgi:hypothetical protein